MKYVYKGIEIEPSVEVYHEIIPYLGNIREKDFFLDIQKCADAWKAGNEILTDFFGDYRKANAPSAAPISYGHLVSIGAPLVWPEDSEPNVKPFVRDIDDAISFMKECRGIDFGDNDLCRHYIEMNRYLQEKFPEHRIAPLTGYGVQGIITTAVLMRGQDLFIDLYEEPEKVKEFLDLLVQSIIEFRFWSNRVNGMPEVSSWAGVADDFAALIPPTLFSEFVVHYWNRIYEACTAGADCTRWLHCEGLYPAHLKYLKDVKVSHFQPSVSPHLTLENVKANTDVPFDWLLYAWEVVKMSDQEIQNWVDAAVEAGVTIVRTQIGKYAWSIGKQDRILAFYKAFDKYRSSSEGGKKI